MKNSKIFAFDYGTDIIGILDINSNIYSPYRYRDKMIQGAKRIISSKGTIVSFNGNGYDLIEISKLLDISSVEDLHIQAEHNDMMKIISAIRWPIDPGTQPIRGQSLIKTYCYYFNHEPTPPSHLKDSYIINNWLDCCMAAELWKKWKREELFP